MRRISASIAVAVLPNKQHLSTSASSSHPSSSTSASDVNQNTSPSNSHPDESYAKVSLSTTSLVGIFAICVSLPFLIGYYCPLKVLHGLGAMSNVRHHQGTILSGSGSGVVLPPEPKKEQLPIPTVEEGKYVPLTLYTSKMFPSAGSATSNTVQIDRSSSAFQFQAKMISDSNLSSNHVSNQQELGDLSLDSEEEDTNGYSHNSDSDGLHLPAGQHLLVDIKHVDSTFLNSEQRLATAMIELITASKLTLLSYHCHSLVPIGVSCAGVLLESHVAFHTWPAEGVIAMDLFTCGGGKLIPILPLIKELFGVRAEGEDSEEPAMLWSHKLRGFRKGFVPDYDSSRNPLDSDMGRYITGRLDHDIKTSIVSASTDFQTVDVYELMDPTTRNANDFHKSLQDDGSYESFHPEYFGPNRVLLLDGVIQSTLYGDAPYHESIVHPAMITHPNPKRVAIIGGGEGATLREVLKHSTVEQVVMIEIDEDVVSLSKEYLPEWQDCSSIAHHKGRAAWCFNDTRADARFEDAMAYFIDNFAPNKDDNDDDESPYEVVVMDCLDPNDSVEFAELLYTSDSYIQSLHDALTDDGILVVQVGESPEVNSPPDETGAFANRSEMMKKLDGIGFKSIHIYEESHAGFLAPWSIIVAFKDVTTRERWYRSSAEIELDLSRRILPTKEGKTSLRYFDGATMQSYQVPGKHFETLYCRQGERPRECNNKSHHEINATISSSAYNPLLERNVVHKPIQSVVAPESARNGKAPLRYTEGVAPGLSLTMDLNSILLSSESSIQSIQISSSRISKMADNDEIIDKELSKSGFKYVEDVAPGLKLEMDLKIIYHTSISEFQEVQVIDSYFGKTLVTDGKTQSSEFDESLYHESLVHPAMLWNAYLHGVSQGTSPKSVFIGGGGELATAREVLKHTSVERVVMVDIDSVVVQASKKYLPEWGGDAVLNHVKMEYIVGDIFEYLKETQEQFDVIIIDVSDPIEAGPATALYTQEFYMQVRKVLKIHGVFITQAGSAGFVPHLQADSDETACFSPIRNTLATVFDHAIPYTCPVASFGEDWGFVIAFNGDKRKARTLVDLPSEVIDQMIEERIEAVPGVPEHRARSVGVKQVLPGSKGSRALVHYDGLVHRRLFLLSKPLREMMRTDDRIMTIANPIYMF